MNLYNEDDPNDDQATRDAKRWRRQQLARIFQLEEALNQNGVSVNLNAKHDFDTAANNDDSVCFLTKIINSVSPKQGNETLNAIFNNHYKVHYIPANGKKAEMLHVADMEMDYRVANQTEAEQAVLEKVKCAMILAHSAKVLGWKEVNFADTTDPLSRYVMKMVCEEMGLNTKSEKIDEAAIPDIKIKGQSLQDLAFTFYNKISDNPELSVAHGKYHEKAENDNKPQPKPANNNMNNNNDDAFGFDIA